MKEVYVVGIRWYDFEDEDCNCSETLAVFDNFYTAKQLVLTKILDEFEVEMELEGDCNDKLDKILEYIDKFHAIYLKQKMGYGKTCIYIDKKPLKTYLQ